MSQLPRYDSYKDSGIEWLGEIPSHWERIRIKFLGDIVLGLTYSPEDIVPEGNGILVLRSSNVQGGQLVFIDNVYVKKVIPEKMITTNEDILICSRNGSRNLIGKCALIKNDGIGQTFGAFMTVLRSSYRTYLYYILSSDLFKFQIGSFLTSTINQLTTYALGNFEIGFPPIFEQKIIVNFLDKRLAQVDALIAKQEILLEKLAEQRIALISHVVTKGLNPDIEMKESGIEWLGKIPSHWDIVPIRYLFEFKNNHRIPVSAEDRGKMTERIYPYYGASGIIDYVEDYIFDEDLLLVAEDGANLLSRSTPLAFKATGKYWVNNHAHIIKPLDANLFFWEYVLVLYDFGFVISGSAQPKLTKDNLASTMLPNPSIKEKKDISEYLDIEIEKHQQIENKYKQMIEKLKEYRSSLITQVVTGKIDVRDISVN